MLELIHVTFLNNRVTVDKDSLGSDHRHLSNIDCLSFVVCPLLALLVIGFFSFFFLLQPFTELMKQTRQVVPAIKQSIIS